MDFEKSILNAVSETIHESIKKRLTDYGSPLGKLIDEVVAKHSIEIKGLLSEAVSTAFSNEQFREEIRVSIRHKVAKALVNQFGESIFEKELNKFKQDPSVRARVVLAVENFVQENSK